MKKIDPYTLGFLFIFTGLIVFLSTENLHRYIGLLPVGLSVLVFAAVRKGGAIVSNRYADEVKYIGKNEGVKIISGNAFVYVGGLDVQDQIYKIPDGTRVIIEENGNVKPIPGIGLLVYYMHGGGPKSKNWAIDMNKRGDSRWIKLLDR